MRWLLALLLLTYSITLTAPPQVLVRPVSDEACLAWVIHDEARGESLRGARAVLDAVLIRMKQRKKTACEVVKEPAQFPGYRDGSFKSINQEMLTRYEVASKMSPVVANCPFFHATYVSPVWRWKMERCKQIGKHIFYKPFKEKHTWKSKTHGLAHSTK